MKLFKQSIGLALMTLVLGLMASEVRAQQGPGGGGPGGGFDPGQMRQRMMERLRERFDVKSDDEWKIIETRVQKVMDARRDVGGGGGMGALFGRGGGRRGGDNQGGDPNAGGRRARGGFGEPSPEADALEKAIDSNASAEELKAKLEAYRAAQKDKEAKLEKAQADLQKVLTAKQEAAAVLMGLLK